MSSRYPNSIASTLSPSIKSAKSRARREPSGVFSLFQTAQIQQFKEAFSLIDQDGDGMVTEADLKNTFSNLGITPTRRMMDDLLTDRPGGESADDKDRGVNFTMFLTMMGEHLLELDSEQELLEAFECFDENDEGKVKCEELRKWLGEVGERMDDEEIDRLLKGPFTDRQGYFNYREWVKVLRVNGEDEH
ncbi:hypothetical protein FRB99_008162 [Tulasnella sp. 403]|nr:hypothetical protein FRB99_008162 [Tulasnella sp. 403]